MQPRNILRSTYEDLAARMVRTVDPALPASYLGEDASTPKVIVTASGSWRRLKKRLAAIDDAIVTLGEGVVQTQSDPSLSPQGRAERLDTLATVAAASVDVASNESLSLAKKIVSDLRATSYPQRSGAGDAGAEAALANIKADLRMVLDPVRDESALADRMKALLERAIGDDDQLAVWLLASSHWPEDYLTSRGVPEWKIAMTVAVDDVLDRHAEGQMRIARETYRVVSNPRTGVNLLPTLFTTLPVILTEVGKWSPTAPRRDAPVQA